MSGAASDWLARPHAGLLLAATRTLDLPHSELGAGADIGRRSSDSRSLRSRLGPEIEGRRVTVSEAEDGVITSSVIRENTLQQLFFYVCTVAFAFYKPLPGSRPLMLSIK